MFCSLPSSRRLRVTVPACITVGSMFCGYLSITFTLSGSFTTAAWLIVTAGILDALDGPIARALGVDGKFGGELDSFADLISFGLAPSLLLYRDYFLHWGIVGLLLAFMPTLAATLRLTRYNLMVISGNREYFSGFTSTANGCLLASYVLFSHDLTRDSVIVPVAAGLAVVSSALMVSGIRYMTVGKFTRGGVWRTPWGALWMPVWLVVLVFPAKAFFPAMLSLMLQGPLGPRILQAFHHMHEIRR